jgi:hypothetical protein
MEPTLVSLLEHRPADTEIFLVFSTKYDDPYQLTDEAKLVNVPAGSTWLNAVNAVLPQVQSPYVQLLNLGLTFTPGWAEPTLRAFDNPLVGAVATPILIGDQEYLGWDYQSKTGPKLHTRSHCDSHQQIVPFPGTNTPSVAAPLQHSACLRMMALELLNGKIPTETGEDYAAVDLGLILQEIGYHTALSPTVLQAHEHDLIATPQLGFGQGWYAEELFARHAQTVGLFTKFVTRPLGLLGQLLTGKVGSTLGHALAWTRYRTWQQHHASMQDTRRAAQALLSQLQAIKMRIDQAHDLQRGATPARTRSSEYRKAA